VGTAVLFVDFGLVLELPGCRGNAGKLTHTAGKALLDNEFELAMDDGQAPGAVTTLYFAKSAFQTSEGCGVLVRPFGEIMLAPPTAGSRTLTPWDGTNPSRTTIRVPNRMALMDAVFFAQGLFLVPGHPTEPYRLTNALRIEIGGP
jgi:hypothetical protein